MILEGVTYHRFQVRFTLADGRRRRWIRWSPTERFLRWEVARELAERFGEEGIKPKSCTLTLTCDCVECALTNSRD